MAKLGNIEIIDSNSPLVSGGAFLLNQLCKESGTVTLNNGWNIEVEEGNPYVVTRINGTFDASTTFDTAHEAVQQGMDLLSITGKGDYSIRNALDEYIIWWKANQEQVLRVVSISTLNVTVGSPTVTVTDQQGNVVPQPVPPPIVYHECLRYIRLSQVTEDLFDSFRNMYLAFEQLLDIVAKKQASEKEGSWIKRSLTVANSVVPLSRAYTTTNTNIVEDVYKNIYVDVRCRLFHAKSQSRLTPQNLTDRKIVLSGLEKLTRIVLLLAEHWLYARRPSGGMTYAGFALMTRQTLQGSTVIVSDSIDPLNRSETLDSPAFATAIPLTTRFAPELSEPGLNCVLGTIECSQLGSLQRLTRYGLTGEGHLLIGAVLETELSKDNIDRFEVQLGMQLNNANSPKRMFKA